MIVTPLRLLRKPCRLKVMLPEPLLPSLKCTVQLRTGISRVVAISEVFVVHCVVSKSTPSCLARSSLWIIKFR